MNVGFITTSRADFGIYLPLIQALKESADFNYYIFVGGMHTSPKFGNSYKLIEKEYKLEIAEKLVTLTNDDSPIGLAQSMGMTSLMYGSIWDKYKDILDVVFILGDRFEMFAASTSLVPYNIKIAHLHGGETTLGAIDDKFRHALTAISDFHFTSHPSHAHRAAEIIGNSDKVYSVGALGVDAIIHSTKMTPDEFEDRFKFNINRPYVLTTYHPETVNLNNEVFINEVINAMREIDLPILCTLPNADTEGSLVREALLKYEAENPDKIKCFENLGQKGYLTAMKYCTYMLGNTSSGIIEGGAFNKPVINIGDRQKGRFADRNVINTPNDTAQIIAATKTAEAMDLSNFQHPYGDGTATKQIINILKKEFKHEIN
jgi:GDP/UDP-N,N'-diacetylbacillosamine 2-epimerase (hydrolysing)